MKKIVVALIACIAIFTFSCLAEGFNLSDMSDEELKQLSLDIAEELHSRSAKDSKYLYSGTYVVGVDIDEGRYLFECVNTLYEKYNYGNISVYSKSDDHGSDHASLGKDLKWSVRLYNEDVIKINGMECVICRED